MLKIAICEDELLAAQDLCTRIQLYLNERRIEHAITRFYSGESLIQAIGGQNEYFDVVFLDIKLDKMNGMETAKAIRNITDKSVLVFVTALKEYVFEAFEVNAVNYIMKPVQDAKLFSVLSRVIALVSSAGGGSLVVRKGGEIRKIPFETILYCEVVDHYVYIYERGRSSEYGSKIENLEQELNDSFFRCHRSYIVNLKYVNQYAHGFATLPGGEKIPVATRRQQGFMKALLDFHRNEVR